MRRELQAVTAEVDGRSQEFFVREGDKLRHDVEGLVGGVQAELQGMSAKLHLMIGKSFAILN